MRFVEKWNVVRGISWHNIGRDWMCICFYNLPPLHFDQNSISLSPSSTTIPHLLKQYQIVIVRKNERGIVIDSVSK